MKYEKTLVTLIETVDWVVRLVALSLLWMALSVAGAVVLGVGPATAAAFAIARRWLRGDTGFSLFASACETFVHEFWKANGLVWAMAVPAAVLMIDMRYVTSHPGGAEAVFGLLSLIPLALYAVTALYVFPVFVHFEIGLGQSIKTALLVGVANPLRSLVGLAMMLLLSMVGHWAVLWAVVPGLFIDGSMRLANGAFVKLHLDGKGVGTLAS